ncbi:sensor histidine kinase [Chondromyces apiculatus]|uniref:histidine kinase n=1 Tax=Chondromyces apiculatus DSM 436 TaxID=1192034 RepID=A0A017T6T4_9BACT|nr:HAMP domain-containing sensor histidine kinase [Chondromyces apiculatus]EYF04968.1 sensor histidine kinase [Chondromyces apiculatus DSM 436]
MKLTRKLVIVLFLGVFMVLTIHAYTRVRRELGLFEVDMKRDAHIIGRVLSAAASEIWLSDGRERALRLIRDANERESHVTIRYIVLPPEPGSEVPLASLEALAPVLHDQEVVVKATPPGKAESLVTYFPLHVEGTTGALELAESLAGERRYIERTIRNTALATGATVLICGLLATVVGVWLVGRPMQQLIGQARRVGGGDLRTGPPVAQDDEIGEMSREMNAMCERLFAAQSRITAETSARLTAIEQLRHADRLVTVGKLASGVAHELGAPLQVVTGRARMICEDDTPREEAVANALIIVEQGHRMAEIIRQLLDFARRRGADKAPVGLRGLLSRTCGMLGPLAEKQGVQITLAEPQGEGEGDLLASVDASQLGQALTNLVLNAIQAMPRGGMITASVGRERARPPADMGGEEGEHVCIHIEDEGEGMTPEVLEHVFEPFFTTKQVGDGTGLGLSVAWGIVREHGGWIDVRSTPGEGSRFSIYLPVEA